MARKKLTRKELLKRSDEFISISSRIANFAGTHRKILQHAGIGIALIVILCFAARAWMKSMNDEAQTVYNSAAQALLDGSMKPDANAEDLRKAGELFSDIMKNYSMSDVFRLALPPSAYVKFLEKDYPGAIRQYTEFLQEVPGNGPYGVLTKLATAACYEQNDNLKTAIETLQPVVDSSPDKPFRDTAMWNLARLYRLDNQTGKEKKILEEFVKQYPDSPFHAMAEAFIKSTAN